MNNDVEILIRYQSRNVLLIDRNETILTNLKCEKNHCFSSYYSGTSQIDNDIYSIACNSEKIILSYNNLNIGEIRLFSGEIFDRKAVIEIKDEKYKLNRKNLKQIFEVEDSSGQRLLTITGKVKKERQNNLFGKFYFDDKLYHSVTLDKEIDDLKKIQLYLACGYCIRIFLDIDMGDYNGKIYR